MKITSRKKTGRVEEKVHKKGTDDDTLFGDKYSNERKQLMLSPTLLEDRMWIDKFQVGSIAVSNE